MEDLEKVQKIGDLVCEGCGPYRDCELELDACMRITEALEVLNASGPEEA